MHLSSEQLVRYLYESKDSFGSNMLFDKLVAFNLVSESIYNDIFWHGYIDVAKKNEDILRRGAIERSASAKAVPVMII